MSTAALSTKVSHGSGATYQEWRDEFITKLATLSTYLTADETNITPGAGARPGVSTEGGYAVYHFNDSLHSTFPIYIRFGFGTQSTATHPRIQVTTGTSTNGSGVLGGTCLSTIASINGSATQVTDTGRQSYMCGHNGFLGINWKTAAAASEGFLFVCRTCDNAGAITSTGYSVTWGIGAIGTVTKTQCFRTAATAVAYGSRTVAAETGWGFFPQNQSATTSGADIQACLGWCWTPNVEPLFGVCGVLDSEVATGNTFSTTLVGSSARTYIALTTICGPFGFETHSGNTVPKYCMLWE